MQLKITFEDIFYHISSNSLIIRTVN